MLVSYCGGPQLLMSDKMTALSASAAEFTPAVLDKMSGLSASAAEFRPSVAASATRHGACEGEGYGRTRLTRNANEFVPGQTAWGFPAAPAPVGSEATIAHQLARLNPTASAWTPGGGADALCIPKGEYRLHSVAEPACWFNADAFSTDSSSPRGSLHSPRLDECINGGDHVTDSKSVDDQQQVLLVAGKSAVAAAAATAARQAARHEAVVAAAVKPADTVAAAHAEHSVCVAEMSERTLKEWLQCFADNGDAHLLSVQLRVWINGAGEMVALREAESEPKIARCKEVIAWLVRLGLDDSRKADLVVRALSELMSDQRTVATASPVPVVRLVDDTLADYSAEDLEDIALDNPRVGKFVTALRSAIADRNSACNAVDASAAGVAAAIATAPCSERSVEQTLELRTYSKNLLLAVRPLVSGTSGNICWRAEPTVDFVNFEKQRSPVERRRSHGEKSSAAGHTKSDGVDRRDREARSNTFARYHKEASPQISPSPTSWAAQVRRAKSLNDAEASDEQFVRDLRSTLNKLTVEKFDQLSDHLISLISQSARPNHGIPLLIQLVFEKATTQHHFINMYVGLCVKLHKWLQKATTASISAGSATNFKSILLNQCQLSFEQYLEPPEGFEGLAGTELYEMQVKYKTKMLGNIKLVGELIKHGMLVSKIAVAVADELVRDDPMVREERLETLAVFLETIGAALDDPSWTHYQALVRVFEEIERLTKDAALPCRIRCLLRDTLDLRRCRWQVKKARDRDKDGPSTIKEVHDKARHGSGSEMSVVATAVRSSRTSRQGVHLSNPTPQRSRRRGYDSGSSHVDSGSSATEDSGAPTFVGQSLAASSSSRGGAIGSLGARPTPHPPSPKVTPPSSNVSNSSGSVLPSQKALPKATPTQTNGAEEQKDSIPSPNCGVKKAVGQTPSPKEVMRDKLEPPRADTIAAVNGSAANSIAHPSAAVACGPAAVASLQSFHKELAGAIRQVGSGALALADAVNRLQACGPLPVGSEEEEAADLIARIVDEPRAARQKLMPLLLALVEGGVLGSRALFGPAVNRFAKDAFADPEDVDPPDLSEIILHELLPALKLQLNGLSLPQCVCDKM